MQNELPILLSDDSLGQKFDDCACPDRAFGVVAESQDGALFAPPAGTHTQPLSHNFHLAFSPFAPAGPSVLNDSAWRRWQQFGHFPQPLTLDIDHQLAAQALLQPSETGFRLTNKNAETLTAWLHVTNACNLDCPYCYVRKSSERMSEATGRNALHQIFYTAQQNQFNRVKLKYAGGEATLHFKLIRCLHDVAQKLADERGLALQEVILSNGYHLRPEDADWLAQSRLKFMISLDGVGQQHDQQRPLKGGGGTFANIQHTIDDILLPRGLRPDITITVTQLNADSVAEAVRWSLERGLPVSLNFYRQNILSASRADLIFEEQRIIDGMLAAYQLFEQFLPERPFFNGLLDRVQAEAHTHTCGVQHSYLVITHQGKLAQCQMHLDTLAGQTLDGDLISLVANGPIQNLSVDQKEGCRSCEFRYRCSGGCSLETYRATGRWDVQSPHCRIYKTLLPQALRLEGLRLLKIHGYPIH